ncbi:MAG: AMP-binding protein [Alphaproteobacteria bacterium]
MEDVAAALEQARLTGMGMAVWAKVVPDQLAVAGHVGSRTFAELNANANRLARLLRAAGIGPDDGVAMLVSNRAEFCDVNFACTRIGVRLTPINWHLVGEEVAYVVDDCEAKALIADVRFAAAAQEAVNPNLRVKLAVGGAIDGFDDYDAALAAHAASDIDDPAIGNHMLYTSGTTGRPKGVFRSRQPAVNPLTAVMQATAAFRPGEDLALCTGPGYHAAPLALNILFPLASGVGVVLMDRWDAEQTLRLVEQHKITHTHLVPTMFHRLLQLPDEVRRRYDASSLRWLLHGAAPCPPELKRGVIDWLGPVLYEYYAATEGGGVFSTSDDWLKKPGTVGRAVEGVVMEIHDENHRPLPANQVGTVYFQAPETGRFEYFKAAEKTASAYHQDFYTMGDHGYVDEDGYLFLTGRSAEQIISGGVNIYPAEIDAVLVNHPAVYDVATIGVPNQEWGEEVKAVVQLREGHKASPDMAETLIAHCGEHLARYKVPRSVDFVADLPRMASGKVQRGVIRKPYWEGQKTAI